ncbi:hypothetical protein T4D_6554 [Trichinella pseudospiralis]|uniref:Uncharacterized protein n=1 Tax=Trichinella pseudospiralis TaxID=6337 RepID=A0A0V1FG36_TRIPS|nr:hypothetical protein T4D_6554 [Trichinella pseudospiralis]
MEADQHARQSWSSGRMNPLTKAFSFSAQLEREEDLARVSLIDNLAKSSRQLPQTGSFGQQPSQLVRQRIDLFLCFAKQFLYDAIKHLLLLFRTDIVQTLSKAQHPYTKTIVHRSKFLQLRPYLIIY